MKRLKLRALKCLLFVMAILPGACHLTVTGPFLYANNSSSAFDFWVLLWMIAIALPVGVWFIPLGDDGDQQP